MSILNYCAHDGKVSLRFLYKRLAYVDEDVDRGIVTRLRYRVTITSKRKGGKQARKISRVMKTHSLSLSLSH